MDAESEMEIPQQSYDQSWKDTVKLIEDDNTMSMKKNLYVSVCVCECVCDDLAYG